jgi:hypothetical protein
VAKLSKKAVERITAEVAKAASKPLRVQKAEVNSVVIIETSDRESAGGSGPITGLSVEAALPE